MKLLLGTTNTAKIMDYQKFLTHAHLQLVTLKDFGIINEPIEIGDTFEENALQKAQFYAEQTEYPTLGDDGGLEIEALDGQPGVQSRRWVGPYGTDEDRINKVMKLMEHELNRRAKFRIAIAVYLPAERESIFVQGETDVIIPDRPSKIRIKNFPYRSVMFLPKYKKYYSELSEKELHDIDHRFIACKELLLKLEPYLNY